jgi:coproporphyrinogen III oxidase
MEREEKKRLASKWFRSLRDEICSSFEGLEREIGSQAKFERNNWNREGGGGGEMSLMKGKIFEKVGVNISTVEGKFSESFAKEIPGTDSDTSFWASGISLVAHMESPLVPAIHMNTRLIITGKSWFGGGTDLTPTFPYQEDTEYFHSILKEACDKFNPHYYEKYKKWCDEYFYLAHRSEPRGVGGIFYDYLDSGSWEEDFNFTKEVGRAFMKAFIPIVEKRMKIPYSQEEKEAQLIKRGRYVEFNLLYDRGTRFGLMTNGKVEAILMSLPPEVKWI